MDDTGIKQPADERKPVAGARWVVWLVMLALPGVLVYVLLDELQTSRWQAHYFSAVAREATFRTADGPSKAIRFPVAGGPYDKRLGYADLPHYLQRLRARGYRVERQAVQSDAMLALADHGLTAPLLPLGLFLPYHEKDQSGLTLYDGDGHLFYQSSYPQRVYGAFADLPPLLVSALLYIENHTLLQPDYPQRNPAVEWSRLGRAVLDKGLHLLQPGYRPAGASTLATQIEKYRHSAAGRTGSGQEKLRQMLSASIRAYGDGEATLVARQRLVLTYLNTVPLAARGGFGEISGIGDGMWLWYGRPFGQVNRALRAGGDVAQAERAIVFKEALSLMIAQRAPSAYLNGDMTVLQAMTDSYLRLMARDGVISAALRDAALKVSLQQQKAQAQIPPLPSSAQKGANAVRGKLAGLLGVSRLYDLDRLDLRADSTLDMALQQAVTAGLARLRDPDAARAAGLDSPYLLQQGAPQGVSYSFTLIERTPQGNKVRVQADNLDQPFDINEGAKLDLGSTAKLRTLVTYLEIVYALHQEYAALDDAGLAALAPDDALRRWAIDYLRQAPQRDVDSMLQAALARRYSASPAERFFTGGGLHSFNNFDKNDDGKTLTVREATQRSVNLVYIRLMRDIARYYAPPLGDDAARQAYLRRFADREGRTFLAGFYNKYRGQPAAAIDRLLVSRARQSPKRLVVIFRSIHPQATPDELATFVATHLTVVTPPPRKVLDQLYHDLAPERFNLADRGYLAGIHPLELWLAGYLHAHPGAGWRELVAASASQRQVVYQWLLGSRNKAGQISRINQMREVDAFRDIHRAWQRLGYPFATLVPSYASALGASADRPAALAELMGILSADGMRLPTAYLERLQFAARTPYDTTLASQSSGGVRVLPPEVARAVRQLLAEVVEQGTARRVAGAFDLPDGTPVAIGGKTGTGDNRFKVFARDGGLSSARVVSRSGAFAFYVGERYFGTLVAYVAGPAAGDYRFTSALPVQVLKVLAPLLRERLSPMPADSRRQAAPR